jgi:hypothetical protein
MNPIAIQYLRALAARHNAYELLLALEENPQADDSCFQSLALIVDRIVFHEISLDDSTLKDLGALVKAMTKEVGSNLAVLSLALSEAEPERGNIHVLLAGYAKWLRALSGTARPHFLGMLPGIAGLLKELEASGVDALIASLNTCASAQDCEILAGFVGRYQETSGNIVIAVAEIASLAIRTDSRLLVERLTAAVDPEAMFDSKPARELLPALAKLKTAAAMGVCVAVARENHSSALNLARRIDEGSVAYLNLFQQIVEEVGISMIGYGTNQLPALIQKAGEERATEFVAQGVAIARRYGRVAAEEFFEQRTAAAKQASPLG